MSQIFGKRVRLRAMERVDLEKGVEWVNDPEVTKGLGLFLPMSMQDEEKWFERVSNGPSEQRPLAIEIREGAGWKYIGNCGLFGLEWVNRSAEIGILIGDKSLWNKGYGTESMHLLLQHGFATLNLNRLFLRVYAENARARRAYEKAGFKLEGTMRQGVYKNGKYDDVHFMSVLRSEWDANKDKIVEEVK